MFSILLFFHIYFLIIAKCQKAVEHFKSICSSGRKIFKIKENVDNNLQQQQ